MTTQDTIIKRDRHGQVGASAAGTINRRSMIHQTFFAASACTHHQPVII